MNVIKIINTASASEVARLYAKHGIDDEWADEATFQQFKSMLNSTVGVSGNMRAVVSAITDHFGFTVTDLR